jgi:hypothetical protein
MRRALGPAEACCSDDISKRHIAEKFKLTMLKVLKMIAA